MITPSPAVLRSFALDGDPVPLPGGEGMSVLVGETVLKRVHDVAEATWTQGLLSHIEQDGFRIPQPVESIDGGWVCDGWSASRFLPGLRSAAPRWTEIATAGLLFGDAAERVRDDGENILAQRTHRWAVADRVAFGEAQVALNEEATHVRSVLEVLLGEIPVERQFVHGDLTGNVCFDAAGVPVILDVSPYLRPRRLAVAIVVGDAVLWNGADPEIARTFAQDAGDRDLLGRALIFRLVAEQLADAPRHGATLQPYREVLAALS